MVRFRRSVCVILDSVQLRDHRSIESISADQTSLNPRFLLILPFTCTHHAESQCHRSIYLFRASDRFPHISGSSAPLWDIIWKVSSFLVSDLQWALSAWWHSHVHCSNLTSALPLSHLQNVRTHGSEFAWQYANFPVKFVFINPNVCVRSGVRTFQAPFCA